MTRYDLVEEAYEFLEAMGQGVVKQPALKVYQAGYTPGVPVKTGFGKRADSWYNRNSRNKRKLHVGLGVAHTGLAGLHGLLAGVAHKRGSKLGLYANSYFGGANAGMALGHAQRALQQRPEQPSLQLYKRRGQKLPRIRKQPGFKGFVWNKRK
jgi:hypothetical protein